MLPFRKKKTPEDPGKCLRDVPVKHADGRKMPDARAAKINSSAPGAGKKRSVGPPHPVEPPRPIKPRVSRNQALPFLSNRSCRWWASNLSSNRPPNRLLHRFYPGPVWPLRSLRLWLVHQLVPSRRRPLTGNNLALAMNWTNG